MGYSTVGVRFTARNDAARGIASMDRQLKGLSRTAKSVAGAFGLYLGAEAVGRGLREGMRLASDFETGMARIHTMLDAGTERYLPAYETRIRELAKTYGESTQSLQSASYDILSATIAPAEAMKVLEANTRAAKAGFTSTALVTNTSARVLKAYGWEASRTAAVLDDMQMAVQRGILTFEGLASNVGDVIGLAANLDVEFKAVMASAASMTKAGLSVDQTFTALKNIFVSFMNPTEEARAAAAELGFALDETSIKGAGLIKIVGKLRKANAAQLEALMPNVRGMVGFAGMLANATSVGEDYKAMADSAGSVQEALNKAMDTTGTKTAKLTERWKDLGRELGKPILTPVIVGVEALTFSLEALNYAIHETPGAFKYSAASAAETFKDIRASGLPMPSAIGQARPQLNLGRDRSPIVQLHPYAPAPSGFSAAEIAAQEKRRAAAYARSDRIQGNVSEGINRQVFLRTHPDWMTPAPSSGLAEHGPAASEIDHAAAYKTVMDSFKSTTDETSTDMTAAWRRMYEDIDKRSSDSWRLRDELLTRERDQYLSDLEKRGVAHEDYVRDTLLVDRWYHAQLEEMAIEKAQYGGNFKEGFAAGIADLQRDLQTVGGLGFDIAQTGINEMSSGLADAVLEGRKLRDIVQGLATDWARMGIEWASRRAFTGLLNTFFPAPVMHAGGIVGQGSAPVRAVSTDVFAGAPRLHNGLRSDEFPAILQRGEEVIAKGGRAGSGQTEALLRELIVAVRTQKLLPVLPESAIENYLASDSGVRAVSEANRRGG